MTYLDHTISAHVLGHHGLASVVIHSWADHTRRNLAQHYDAERVSRIMGGGDPKTQADIARWNALGRRDAA